MTPPQLLTSNHQDWGTPKVEIFDKLHKVFKFELDPCTTEDNPLGLPYFYTPKDNGLGKQWLQDAFVNPPYRQTKRWIEHACNMASINSITAVCLVASRTDTKVWQDTIFPFARAICFMRGRQHFIKYNTNTVGPATFGSAIVMFSPRLPTTEQWYTLHSFGKVIAI